VRLRMLKPSSRLGLFFFYVFFLLSAGLCSPAGNPAPDFEAEAVFDQEFIKVRAPLVATNPPPAGLKRASWGNEKMQPPGASLLTIRGPLGTPYPSILADRILLS